MIIHKAATLCITFLPAYLVEELRKLVGSSVRQPCWTVWEKVRLSLRGLDVRIVRAAQTVLVPAFKNLGRKRSPSP